MSDTARRLAEEYAPNRPVSVIEWSERLIRSRERKALLAGWDAAIEHAAQTVERLNADYRDRDGLGGQRGFSVEAVAAIRAERSEG